MIETRIPVPPSPTTPWRSPRVVIIAIFAAAIIGGFGLALLQRTPSAIHDAQVGNCRTGPNVSVNITNHSATAADYVVVVRLVDGAGQEIARGDAYATALDPQHTVERSVDFTTGKTFDSCEIAEVQRVAA